MNSFFITYAVPYPNFAMGDRATVCLCPAELQVHIWHRGNAMAGTESRGIFSLFSLDCLLKMTNCTIRTSVSSTEDREVKSDREQVKNHQTGKQAMVQ